MKKMNLFAPDHHCLPILYWSGSSELIFVLHVKRTKVYQYFLVLQILLMSSSRNYLCPTKEGYKGKNENSGEEGESENEKKYTVSVCKKVGNVRGLGIPCSPQWQRQIRTL